MIERDLILPDSVPTLNRLLLGETAEEGHKVYSYGFLYKCKCGNELMISALATEKDSANQVEDMLNASFERHLREEEERHQRVQGLLSPDVNAWDDSLKLDVAEELRHIRNYIRKRKWARKVWHKGVSVNDDPA